MALLQRLQNTSKGCRELDFLIWHALSEYGELQFTEDGRIEAQEPMSNYPDLLGFHDKLGETLNFSAYGEFKPAYTTSIDAALTLVPEGWGWAIEDPKGQGPVCSRLYPPDRWPTADDIQFGATPPLAICIAALLGRGLEE